MSRLLHILFLLIAALGFCLNAQQLSSVNHMAAARSLERQHHQQQPRNVVSGFLEVERPTSVQEGPPPAQVAQTSTAGGGMRDREGAGAVPAEDDGQQSQPRPTRVKTPAAETVLPTNTKVPVAAVSGAVVSPTSDPGFLALVASLGLMTLGMTLV